MEHSNVCYIMKFDGKDENGKSIYRFEAVEKAKPFKNKYGLDIFEIDGNLTEGRSGLGMGRKDQFESNMSSKTPEQIEKMINMAIEKYGLSPRYTNPNETRKGVFEEKESSGVILMKPLFVDGNFNREGKRIRVRQIKTVTIEGTEYSLWESAGKAERSNARAANDTNYLMILANGYLTPCGGETEFSLAERAGYETLTKEWYGDFKGRGKYFDGLRKDRTFEESEDLVKARLVEEDNFVKEHMNDVTAQAEYINSHIIKPSIARYIDARDNGGKHYDFVGAAFLNELEACERLATRLKEERRIEDTARREEARRQEEQEEKERAAAETQALAEAENIFVNGGKIDDGTIVTKLADKYGITIPIRTRGWILNTFSEASFNSNGSVGCTYMRRCGSNTHGSDKIYDILFAIKRAIQEAQSISA